MPPDPTSNQPAEIARPALPATQRWLLGLAGALILGVAAALLFAADTPGPTTTVTEPVTTTVATTIEGTSTKAVTTIAPAPAATWGKSAAPSPATTVASETKPTGTKALTTPSVTKVTTTPGHAAQASDTLVVLLVGFGLVLLISGISGRITKITLPGGAQLGIDEPAVQKIRTVAREEAGTDDPVAIETLYQGAVMRLTPQYGGSHGQPPVEAIKEAVEGTVKAVEATADTLKASSTE